MQCNEYTADPMIRHWREHQRYIWYFRLFSLVLPSTHLCSWPALLDCFHAFKKKFLEVVPLTAIAICVRVALFRSPTLPTFCAEKPANSLGKPPPQRSKITFDRMSNYHVHL